MDAVNKQLFLQMLLLGLSFDTLPDYMTSKVHGCHEIRFDYMFCEEGGSSVTIALSQCHRAPGGELVATPIYEVRVFPLHQAAVVVSKQEGQRCIDAQNIEGRVNVGTQRGLNVDLMCWLNECIERGHHFWHNTAEAVQG